MGCVTGLWGWGSNRAFIFIPEATGCTGFRVAGFFLLSILKLFCLLATKSKGRAPALPSTFIIISQLIFFYHIIITIENVLQVTPKTHIPLASLTRQPERAANANHHRVPERPRPEGRPETGRQAHVQSKIDTQRE